MTLATTIRSVAPRLWLVLPVAASLLLGLTWAPASQAQSATAVIGEGGPRDQNLGGKGRPGTAPAPEGEMTPRLRPGPLQRLEAGALLCKTEADLQQHVAAVAARLNGTEASESGGCRLVQTMTPVSVVDRHGPGRTQVKVGNQLGWTDTMIRSP